MIIPFLERNGSTVIDGEGCVISQLGNVLVGRALGV